MSTLIDTIREDVSVGIWNNEENVIKIFDDKILIKTPYVRWCNNSGSLDYRITRITDPKQIHRIRKAIEMARQDAVDVGIDPAEADLSDLIRELCYDF